MRILMSGGTGFIGRALTKELLARGHQVTILSRNPQKHQVTMPDAQLVQWDGRTLEGWGHLMEDSDAVINLAGASIAGDGLVNIFTQPWNEENKQRIRQSRLYAGQALVQAMEAAANKPRVLLQSSAVGYYGPHGDDALSEDNPAGNDFLAQVCQEWESSTQPVEEMGVRRVVFRSGLVMSPEGGILPMMLLPFRLFVGGPLGHGRQAVPWIHMQDEVQALIYLMENEAAQGVYNLSAPNPVNYAQFSKVAGKVMKRPSFFPVPGFVLKLVLGKKSTLVLDGQRAVPTRLLKAGYKFTYAHLESALRNLLSKE